MSKLTLAVDPGKQGGFAWLLDGDPVQQAAMPGTWGGVIDLLREMHPVNTGVSRKVAYIEELIKHMGPGTPASTMAVYAASWGFIFGALRMAGWTVIRVRPQEWQKGLGLGITGRQKAVIVPGMTPGQIRDEKKRVSKLNAHLKTEWKAKLKDDAQRRNPHLAVTLKTADALLILAYAGTLNQKAVQMLAL